MDGEGDNGYHSNDNEALPEDNNAANEESYYFGDLQYEDHLILEEPNFEAVRTERYKRNNDAMKYFSPFVAKSMHLPEYDESFTLEDRAATTIQKYVKGFLARRLYVSLLLESFEENERLRREKTMEQIEEADLLIENHKLEVQFDDYNVVKKNKNQRMICYVITIQRAWRKFSKRRKCDLEKMHQKSQVAFISNEKVETLCQDQSGLLDEVTLTAIETLNHIISSVCAVYP